MGFPNVFGASRLEMLLLNNTSFVVVTRVAFLIDICPKSLCHLHGHFHLDNIVLSLRRANPLNQHFSGGQTTISGSPDSTRKVWGNELWGTQSPTRGRFSVNPLSTVPRDSHFLTRRGAFKFQLVNANIKAWESSGQHAPSGLLNPPRISRAAMPPHSHHAGENSTLHCLHS